MYKKLYLILICFIGLTLTSIAVENTNKIEVTAKSIYTSENTVHASEGVVVYYDGSIIKSERATYNKVTKLLILDDNIEMIGYQNSKEYANHMEIKTDTKEVNFKKLFLASENDVWLISNNARRIDGIYHLGRTVLSSCDVNNPLWHMSFSNSTFDSKEEYMKIYNAKISFLNIPVFYTPYLAFSTNKKRSSGLLFPRFGYNERQGYLYEQPIFWAISPSVDVEFNPQIWTERSMGIYSTLRFADSNYSKGKIRVGYFKDKQSYTDEYKLKNEKHYGLEFNYESTKVFKDYLPVDYKDELYINTTYLNDIDYLNLQKSRLQHFGIDTFQESRINYFAYNNSFYTGINAKYFINTRLDSNDETQQVLPSIQWHKYLKHLVWNNFTYSVDAHMNNITRKTGSTLKQAEFTVPLEYTVSLMDNFINIAFSEEFYYSKYFFGNQEYEYDNFQYMSNVHKAKIFTDLTKKYDNFTHVLLPSVSYSKPGNEDQSPINFSDLNESQKELFDITLKEEQYNFTLGQYFYDNKANLKFFQRLTQKYFPNRIYKWDNLINETGYNWKKWKLYNQVVYSNEFHAIYSLSSWISLDTPEYKFRLGHTYNKELSEKVNKVRTNNIDMNFAYEYDNKINLSSGIIYDLETSMNKRWTFGLGYHRDCWSINASLRQDIRPTSVGKENPISFYLELNFSPFGSIGLDNTQLGLDNTP